MFSSAPFTSSVAFFGTTSLPCSSLTRSNCNCTKSCQSTVLLTSAGNKLDSSGTAVEPVLNRGDVKLSGIRVIDQEREYSESPSHVGRTKKFPQAIIIGVKKGGTRALINMLKIHPQICAAKTEVHFFDKEENFLNGVQWYIERMPSTSKNQVTIEKSPSYFVVDEVPLRMSMLSPQVKLLLIVRNPIERLVSDFLQLDSKRLKKNGYRYTFEELVFHSSGEVNKHYPPVYVSMYDIHFQRWLKYFNLEQILIVDGDALIANPIHELQKAEKFLQVSNYFNSEMFYFNETKGFYCWKKLAKSICLGDGKGREHPSLSESVRLKLHNFFSPHNDFFFNLSQSSFNW